MLDEIRSAHNSECCRIGGDSRDTETAGKGKSDASLPIPPWPCKPSPDRRPTSCLRRNSLEKDLLCLKSPFHLSADAAAWWCCCCIDVFTGFVTRRICRGGASETSRGMGRDRFKIRGEGCGSKLHQCRIALGTVFPSMWKEGSSRAFVPRWKPALYRCLCFLTQKSHCFVCKRFAIIGGGCFLCYPLL